LTESRHDRRAPAWEIRAQPWRLADAPARILAIRLQAIGDVAITLPYLRALQKSLPETEIDMVTRKEAGGLPRAVDLFRHVDELGGGRNERYQVLLAVLMAARLRARRYDVVLDLQNNRVSRTIRRAIRPRAWSTFDRVSPNSAGERTRRTIEAAGFPLQRVEASLPLKNADLGLDALRHADWDSSRELVVFSPAGAFATRNWPIEYYARFAELWQRRRPAQFAVMGLEASRDKAAALRAALGSDLLNLVGRTTLSEALAIVQRARLVLTEDCGLMHMAWVSGVPTLALFGSSRHDWSAPLGEHTLCLHSGDLPCGACMEPTCRFGDIHCLTRYSPEYVVREAEGLIARRAKGQQAPGIFQRGTPADTGTA
jgi:heptosyltransferase-2